MFTKSKPTTSTGLIVRVPTDAELTHQVVGLVVEARGKLQQAAAMLCERKARDPATFEPLLNDILQQINDRRRRSELRAIVDGKDVRGDATKRQAKYIGKLMAAAMSVTDGHANPFATGQGGGDEWFTPVQYLELVREVLGDIDCCPASNQYAQERFDFGGRCRHFTKEDDA